MNVSEVMTHGVYITSPDETIRDAAQIMADLNTGVLPIGESDRLTGMLTDRDITTRVVAEARDVTTTLVRDVMSSDVRYCFDDEDVREAAGKMSHWQVRRLPVLNRERRLVGIVSLGDLAREANPAVTGEVLSVITEAASDH